MLVVNLHWTLQRHYTLSNYGMRGSSDRVDGKINVPMVFEVQIVQIVMIHMG